MDPDLAWPDLLYGIDKWFENSHHLPALLLKISGQVKNWPGSYANGWILGFSRDCLGFYPWIPLPTGADFFFHGWDLMGPSPLVRVPKKECEAITVYGEVLGGKNAEQMQNLIVWVD